MIFFKTSIISVLLFLTGFFTNTTFAQMQDDSTAIIRQTERWVEAAREENADALATIYTEDAVMLPPGAPPIEGKANIRSLFTGQFVKLDATYNFTTQELVVADKWAYRWGNYEISAETADGKKVETKDKFIEIWKKDSEGEWLITRDIWNRTEPISQQNKQ